MFSIREILEIAKKLERNAELFYRGSTRKFSDPSLVSLLERLADAERRHYDWFSRKRELEPASAEDRQLREMESTFLREIVGDQTFSLKEVDLSSVRDTHSLVNFAIEYENDTILFYEFFRSLTDDAVTIEKLDEIIAEERNHILELKEW